MYLEKNYDDFQEIVITNKKLIKDFIDTHIKIWEEDILKFENFKDLLNIENIKSIEFYSYISITEDLNYTFIFNENSRRNFYLDNEVILTWLNNHTLIK